MAWVSEPDQVRGDARQLEQDDADDLRALGNREVHQLLDRRHVGHVVPERREVVHAVGDRDRLVIVLGLHGLLHAGVEVADHGLERDHGLAVQLDHEAEHPVGRGVLRPHVDRDGLEFGGRRGGHAIRRWRCSLRGAGGSISGSGIGPCRRLAVDLLLQLHDAVDQGFGARRAARHVDVDRHHRVHALDDGVVVEDAAAGGAGAHGDDPLRLGHLVVDPAQHGRHLLADACPRRS